MSRFVFAITGIMLSVSCGFVAERDFKQQVRDNDRFGKEADYRYGDPFQLIEDTDLDNVSPFNEAKFAIAQTYIEGGVFHLKSNATVKLGKRDSLQKMESDQVSKTQDPSEIVEYKFMSEGSDFVLSSTAEETMRLVFVKSDDRFELKSVDGEDAVVLHYSAADDLSVFSFLMDTSEGEIKSLTTIYFFKNDVAASLPEKIDEKYISVLGPGIPVTQTAPIKFVADDNDYSYIQSALSQWVFGCYGSVCNGKLGLADFDLAIGTQRPFSDVRQNSIKIVNGYFRGSGTAWTSGGFALSFVNPTNGRMHAASAVVFAAVMDSQSEMEQALSHEIGHMFGLGHQFDRSPETGESLYPSVMGYEGLDVQSFDLDHIEALYGPYVFRPTKEDLSR
jgi:hypothetical protein